MKELIEYIAKAIVSAPNDVKVTEETTEDNRLVIKLEVAVDDKGRVIGKQGRTARSIRTILGAAGMKLKKRFTLEILE